jgi:hypothetical protein
MLNVLNVAFYLLLYWEHYVECHYSECRGATVRRQGRFRHVCLLLKLWSPIEQSALDANAGK